MSKKEETYEELLKRYPTPTLKGLLASNRLAIERGGASEDTRLCAKAVQKILVERSSDAKIVTDEAGRTILQVTIPKGKREVIVRTGVLTRVAVVARISSRARLERSRFPIQRVCPRRGQRETYRGAA